MRFHADGPSIPDELLERCDAGRVVFLCGAGVSLPSGMPSFVGLTEYVIDYFDPPVDSEIMVAFNPWLDKTSTASVPLDQIFNLLHLKYGKDVVNALVTERLSDSLQLTDSEHKHSLIKRISSNSSGTPQIVTTNFDRLFELEPRGEQLVKHVPPAFPDLNFGSKIEGITYLHGRLVDADSESHPYVLSSADFGRAYLSEGWATNFVRNLLEQYTVVLVGYQAEDPPIKYLLQGLNHDGQFDRSRLFAFDKGLPEDIEIKWRDRGVTAIAYSEHSELWATMRAWAERADDHRMWRASVISKCHQDPKTLTPYERGQAAHVLRTVQGARLFSLADPLPHPEWICVMDSYIRSAKEVSSRYGEEVVTFRPYLVYRLDDDLEDIPDNERRQGINNDNLLVWRDRDNNPHDAHRLGGRPPEGFEEIPRRLEHLITWIGKSIDSPVIAWWTARQNRLHPQILQSIERRLRDSKSLHESARHTWRLILEHHRDPRNRELNSELNWSLFKKRIRAEGWTASTLREFQTIIRPKLVAEPPLGIGRSRPPLLTWNDIKPSEVIRWRIELLKRYNDDLSIPDDILHKVFNILKEQLIIAAGLINDTETRSLRMPTCYPNREVKRRRVTSTTNSLDLLSWFIQLFDRLVEKSPELAYAHATTWLANDYPLFLKLKLYTFNKLHGFDANFVARALLTMSQKEFWDTEVQRELLFLLVDRWNEFSQGNQDLIMRRILVEHDCISHQTEESYQERIKTATRFARYIELHGCELSKKHTIKIAEMVGEITGWRDEWAKPTLAEQNTFASMISSDENPNILLDIPINEIIPKAKQVMGRDFDNFTEKRPFLGLVKANPQKALDALIFEGESGEYEEYFWESLLDDFPSDVDATLKWQLQNQLIQLPLMAIAKLPHTLARWLKNNLVKSLELDIDRSWVVYDHIVDGIFHAGSDATTSGIIEVGVSEKTTQQSRRTLDHAINGPIGMCAQALLSAIPGEKQQAGSLIPNQIKSRVERLFSAPGEGSDHAISIATKNLNKLMFIDPFWTQERIIPMLTLEHRASEPAWHGFLSNKVPQPQLAEIIKLQLLDLVSKIEKLNWENGIFEEASKWVGYMRLFYTDVPGGITKKQMLSALRAMSDETRNQFISWLGQVAQQNESGWEKLVTPFFREDWPKECRSKTPESMRAWMQLLYASGASFPIVYKVLKKFLVPLESNDDELYLFTAEISDGGLITAQYPELVLDMMSRITPQILTLRTFALPMVLALIIESQPNLESDPRYVRLIDLVERS